MQPFVSQGKTQNYSMNMKQWRRLNVQFILCVVSQLRHSLKLSLSYFMPKQLTAV